MPGGDNTVSDDDRHGVSDPDHALSAVDHAVPDHSHAVSAESADGLPGGDDAVSAAVVGVSASECGGGVHRRGAGDLEPGGRNDRVRGGRCRLSPSCRDRALIEASPTRGWYA